MHFFTITLTILSTFFHSNHCVELSPRVQYQWNYINYTWPSPEAYSQAIQDGSYIKERNVISGIKVWKDRIYLTVPRLKKGVPATLTSIPLNPVDNNRSPLLSPYPNWQMQNESDCSAFQLVQSMEIDPKGRMWVISNGRTEIRSKTPKSVCPSRLIILDLEDGGKMLMDYTFPEFDVVHWNSSYLNDIVLDHEDGGFAYITDNDSHDPGIIVFSLRDRYSWKVRHDWSMYPSKIAENVTVNGTSFKNNSPVNGIALSPVSADLRLVYYLPIASFDLFAVPTWVLKSDLDIDNYVIDLGTKYSQTGGMVTSATGDLYFGLIGYDAVAKWNTEKIPLKKNLEIIIRDPERSQYPDGFTIDASKRLWYISNRLQAFRTDSVDTNHTNFRVIVSQIDANNYQYYTDDRAPTLLPKVNKPHV